MEVETWGQTPTKFWKSQIHNAQLKIQKCKQLKSIEWLKVLFFIALC